MFRLIRLNSSNFHKNIPTSKLLIKSNPSYFHKNISTSKLSIITDKIKNENYDETLDLLMSRNYANITSKDKIIIGDILSKKTNKNYRNMTIAAIVVLFNLVSLNPIGVFFVMFFCDGLHHEFKVLKTIKHYIDNLDKCDEQDIKEQQEELKMEKELEQERMKKLEHQELKLKQELEQEELKQKEQEQKEKPKQQ